MFDDYDYKKVSTRINIKFIQERDEPLYPWEIAGFLNKINTVYYKFDLLNSICTALNKGIKPEDIYILDKSLPLYQRYSRMNILDDSEAAELFYKIGRPTPLVPEFESYHLSFIQEAFSRVNSFLFKNHIKPLPVKTIRKAFDIVKKESLGDAEEFIIQLATERAEKSRERAVLRGDDSPPISWADIEKCLTQYQAKKVQLREDIACIRESLSNDGATSALLDSQTRIGKRRCKLLLDFFHNFNKIQRPLVYVRVSEDQFRVLGRFLVNKKEKTGLELKEIRKNSPLGALIEGGLALYQTVRQEKRAEELHKLEMEKAKLGVQIAQESLKNAQLKNLEIELEIAKKLESAIENGDMKAIEHVGNTFLKKQISKAYQTEESNAERVIKHQGLTLDRESIKVIDIKV